MINMKRFLKSLSILTLLFCVCCGKREKADEQTSSVKYAYYHWVHRVESSRGIPDGVAALYANNAILFPTLAAEAYTGSKMIKFVWQV